jgi:ribosomal protein S12 methylthiotransferase accessory factor
MSLSRHLMRRAVGNRHGVVMQPQRAPVGQADVASIVHFGVPRVVDAPWQSAAGGVGRDVETAWLAAVGETVERTAAALVQLPVLRRRELAVGQRIDAEEFALFTPQQRREPDFPYGSLYDEDCPYVEVFALDGSESRWVPQPLVGLQDPHRTGVSTSSGLAAGESPAAALLRGLQEVIERDALMTTWLHGLAGRVLPTSAASSAEIARLGGEAVTIDLTPAYSPFPVAAVMGGIPERGRWRYSLGVACRETWEAAAEKAYLEWNQGVLFASVYSSHLALDELPGPGELTSFDQHAVYYTLHPDEWARLPLWSRGGIDESPDPGIGLRPMTEAAPDPATSLGQVVEAAAATLRSAGIRLFHRDLTTIDAIQAGLHVVRVLSPDLAAIYAHQRWPYLHKVDGFLPSRYPGRAGESRFPFLLPHPLG